MNLQQRFQDYWKQEIGLVPANSHLILAVSGGLDSVVLADLVFNAGYSFSIAHCNFRLRGEESDRDEGFVRTLAERYGAEAFVQHFDTADYAASKKIGIQEAARELRYGWFLELRTTVRTGNESKKNYLATAHHADDNIETVLFHIFRGTGITGLQGILPRQDDVIRPLLFASRAEILAYAKEKSLAWVEDSSNESTKYTRNYIRLEILPLLKQVFPSVGENISENIARWREAGELYRQAIEVHRKKLCEYRGEEVHIPVLKLQKTAPVKTVLYEIVKDYGFSPAQAEEILGLLDRESGHYVASGTHRVLRNRAWLIIAPLAAEEADHIVIDNGTKKLKFPGGQLSLEKASAASLPESANVALLDATKIKYPLLLRKWRQGDYFYPLGLAKKKKISRFLIDRKVSLIDKEKTWVLESDKKIIWVVGHRIDDRFKIKPSTRQTLRISLTIPGSSSGIPR